MQDANATPHIYDEAVPMHSASTSTKRHQSAAPNPTAKPRLDTKTTIHNRAMLVGLTIRSWSARKHDKRVTNEANTREQATADAGRYNKRLLPKEALTFMQSKASAARIEHYKRTLPWTDDGSRILSTAGYFDYMRNIKRLTSDFNAAADDFANSYPQFVQDAKRTLGNMYNPEDYPSPKQIRAKFAMELRVLPMPQGEDFRANLPEEDIAQIQRDIDAQIADALTTAQSNTYERITDVLTHMVAKLNEYTPGKDGARPTGIFRDSLIGNIRDLCDILPSLNVTEDTRLNELTAQLHRLSANEPADLRVDAKLRASVASEAQAIIDKVSDFIA